MQQHEDATKPALQQLERTKPNSNTKDYVLIGETILIIGLLSFELFCYTTSLTSDKTQLDAATSGKAQPESTQLESTQPEAGVKRSKKPQLVATQSKEDNIFDM